MKKILMAAVLGMAALILSNCTKEEMEVTVTASHKVGKIKNGKYPVTFSASVKGCASGDVDELGVYVSRNGVQYMGSPAHHTLSISKTVSYDYKQKVSYYAEVKVKGKTKSSSTKSFTVK